MEKLTALLRELIKNKCVNLGTPDSGGELKSVITLKNFFDSYKIKSEVFESKPGRGSILCRIKGENEAAPSLMYMGHLDVVPVNEDDWSGDPFSGDERGGYVWGRGAVDMLNMTACAAYAFAELSVRPKKPFGNICFLAVADEEASGRFGARWLVENHWDKVKTDYMITEGGGYFLQAHPRLTLAITRGEKGIGWTKLSTRGSAGHGSLPYRSDNAGYTIAKAVDAFAGYREKIVLTSEYREIVKKLTLRRAVKTSLANPLLINRALDKLSRSSLGLAKHLHALSRMTLSPNVFSAGQKINTIPDHGCIECDVRILPGQTIEDVIKEVKYILGDLENKFNIEVIDFFPANISPLDTPLYDAITEIATSVYPQVECVPNIFSGVTDARFWRMRGTVVYGFALFDETMTLDEYTQMLHGKDERISMKSLDLTYNFFLKLPDIFYSRAARIETHDDKK